MYILESANLLYYDKYISRKNEKEFIEIGPGHILSKLISQIADVEYAFGEKIVVIH